MQRWQQKRNTLPFTRSGSFYFYFSCPRSNTLLSILLHSNQRPYIRFSCYNCCSFWLQAKRIAECAGGAGGGGGKFSSKLCRESAKNNCIYKDRLIKCFTLNEEVLKNHVYVTHSWDRASFEFHRDGVGNWQDLKSKEGRKSLVVPTLIPFLLILILPPNHRNPFNCSFLF